MTARLLICLITAGLVCSMGEAEAGEYVVIEHPLGLIHLYRAAPDELSIFWKGSEGKPLRTFDALIEELEKKGQRAPFLINGGIFEPGGIPTGLHIEQGKLSRPLNDAQGKGNFYLKPNGVFCIDDTGAHVFPTETYAESKVSPRLALQSGPMLLIDDKIHPAFNANSKSKLHRNGVGILPDGRVLFVMTDLSSGTRVNLFQFAVIFRQYGCRNALFLDGDLSMMRIVQDGKVSPIDARDPTKRELVPGIMTGSEFGAILGIVEADPSQKKAP